MIASLPAARASSDAAEPPTSRAKAAACSGRLSCRESSKPARCREAAIGQPMRPMPMTPTRIRG